MIEMALPPDFPDTVSKIEKYGILKESEDEIYSRLVAAVNGVGSVEASVKDLGARDWAEARLKEMLEAIHTAICDPKKGGLKEEYADLVNVSLTTEGIMTVANYLVSVVAPGYAASRVLAYLVIWLVKKGLNSWCSLPAPKNA
jgi:hypothetical protein